MKRINICSIMLACLGGCFFFASMVVFQIKGFTFSTIFQVFFSLIAFLLVRRINVDGMFWVLCIYTCLVITTVYAYNSDYAKVSYNSTALYMMITLVPTLLFSFALNTVVDVATISVARKAILLMVCIQTFWAIAQYIVYSIFEVDITAFVFSKILRLQNINIVTGIRNGVIGVTGLSWHASVLVPIIAILYFLNESYVMRMIAVILAVFTGNSTAIVVIVACVAISLMDALFNRKRPFDRRVILLIIVSIIIIIPLLMKWDLLTLIRLRFEWSINRILGGVSNGSTKAHKRYFTELFPILSRGSVMKALLGYGEGCSGYPFSLWYYQYRATGNWAVESDVVNILLSRGIIGFLAYYGFLFSIVKNGFVIDKRYSYITLAIMAGGFSYNIQFEWTFLIMVLFYVCINRKLNLFEAGGNKCDKNEKYS